MNQAVIVEEVERLRWPIWNGKAKKARLNIDPIHKVMHVFMGSCWTIIQAGYPAASNNAWQLPAPWP
jgi:hypothetical protein